jgi:hypothetical protein
MALFFFVVESRQLFPVGKKSKTPAALPGGEVERLHGERGSGSCSARAEQRVAVRLRLSLGSSSNGVDSKRAEEWWWWRKHMCIGGVEVDIGRVLQCVIRAPLRTPVRVAAPGSTVIASSPLFPLFSRISVGCILADFE